MWQWHEYNKKPQNLRYWHRDTSSRRACQTNKIWMPWTCTSSNQHLFQGFLCPEEHHRWNHQSKISDRPVQGEPQPEVNCNTFVLVKPHFEEIGVRWCCLLLSGFEQWVPTGEHIAWQQGHLHHHPPQWWMERAYPVTISMSAPMTRSGTLTGSLRTYTTY